MLCSLVIWLVMLKNSPKILVSSKINSIWQTLRWSTWTYNVTCAPRSTNTSITPTRHKRDKVRCKLSWIEFNPVSKSSVSRLCLEMWPAIILSSASSRKVTPRFISEGAKRNWSRSVRQIWWKSLRVKHTGSLWKCSKLYWQCLNKFCSDKNKCQTKIQWLVAVKMGLRKVQRSPGCTLLQKASMMFMSRKTMASLWTNTQLTGKERSPIASCKMETTLVKSALFTIASALPLLNLLTTAHWLRSPKLTTMNFRSHSKTSLRFSKSKSAYMTIRWRCSWNLLAIKLLTSGL